MTPRTFIVWLALAAVTFIGAALAVWSQPGLQQAQGDLAPVFPELREDPDAIGKITVANPTTSFSVVRQEDSSWAVAEKSGYPADPKAVRDLVVALADVRFVEAKTSLPERFSRLEVEDLEAEGAKSRRLSLENREGGSLADVILGKRSGQRTSRDSFGAYLRRPDEQQAWLVNREIELEEDPVEWLDKEIINVAAEDILSIEFAPPEGNGYRLTRETGEAAFALSGGSEERPLDPSATQRSASALLFLNLEDVKPRGEVSLPANKSVTRFLTTDQIEVTAELATLDEKHWTVIAARFVGEDDSEEAEAAKAKVDAINARVGDWAYEVSKYEADRLRQPLEELIKKEEGS